MGQEESKSRIYEKEHSTRMQNGSQIFAGPHDSRTQFHNSEPPMYRGQLGGKIYEQEAFGPAVYYHGASSHDQPQRKPIKSKKKDEKKKKNRKSKRSKHAPDSDRSASKRKKENETLTTEQVHVEIAAKMKDRPNDTTPVSTSDGMHTKGSNNLDYQDSSHALRNVGQATSFPEKRNEGSHEEVKNMKERLSRKEEELYGVRQELENTKRYLNEKLEKYEADMERNTKKIKQLEAEKNDLLNRFVLRISSEAAARMTHNNPNITDLSDKDRPTKISERYSELYDNQWTDAFDSLLKNHDLSEPKAIAVLLDVLFVSFNKCKEARKQREALLKSLNEFVGVAGDDQDVTVLEVEKMLNAARKKNIAKMQNHYTEKVQETLEKKYKDWLQCIRPYMENCIEICLLMNIQNPPIELKGLVIPSSDKPSFDLDVFRPYTKSGSKIEYMVWPALCLFETGPLLCKGVAQGMHDSSKGHKPSSDEHNGNKEEPKTDVKVQKDGLKGELMKNREPNYNNDMNEERDILFEQKKEVQGTSNSKGSDRDKRSQQSHTNMYEKSQTQHNQPGSPPNVVTNHSASTRQKKDETGPRTENRTIINVASNSAK